MPSMAPPQLATVIRWGYEGFSQARHTLFLLPAHLYCWGFSHCHIAGSGVGPYPTLRHEILDYILGHWLEYINPSFPTNIICMQVLDRNVLAQLSVSILITHNLVQGHWSPTTIHSRLIFAYFSIVRLMYLAKIACASSYDFLAMGVWFPHTSGLFYLCLFSTEVLQH